jgi:hypothetical protein
MKGSKDQRSQRPQMLMAYNMYFWLTLFRSKMNFHSERRVLKQHKKRVERPARGSRCLRSEMQVMTGYQPLRAAVRTVVSRPRYIHGCES